MTIQIASSDQITIRTIDRATVIHADDSKIIVLIDLNSLTSAEEAMLETDGLWFSTLNDEEMTKTKTQMFITSNPVLATYQAIIEFEL